MKKHSKYCTSVSGNYQECMAAIQLADFVELRLDLLELSQEERIHVYKTSPLFIATHRGDAKTNQLLLKEAVENGARYIDLDISRPANHILEMKAFAEQNNCELILSAHDFNETPSLESLLKIYEKATQFSPTYVKIVTSINSPKDISTILSLYGYCDNVIAFGMGNLGKITRITALHCGAPYTYASASSQHLTAKGQLTVHSLKKMEIEMLDMDTNNNLIQKHIQNDHQQQNAI